MTRQIILDTETTGLETRDGHRIIEVGCVELIDRQFTGNNFHQYLQPDREIDAEAIEVHGITNEFLADKPRFEDIAADLVAYLDGAELIIHNAPFDIGFLNYELEMTGGGYKSMTEYCTVTDTLVMARDMFPGQRNTLDALCKRYEINNSQRVLHGALLDSEILGDVYLAMTGGQVSLLLGSKEDNKAGAGQAAGGIRRISRDISALPVIRADADELSAHAERLAAIEGAAGRCLWAD
ncbi:MAG: DNA polymerase III subunit epsilon [Thiolinea sp.]